jgi:hypothetical protein
MQDEILRLFRRWISSTMIRKELQIVSDLCQDHRVDHASISPQCGLISKDPRALNCGGASCQMIIYGNNLKSVKRLTP